MTTFQTSHLNFEQWLSEYLKEQNCESKEKKNQCRVSCPFYAVYSESIMTKEWHLVDMLLNSNISKALKPFEICQSCISKITTELEYYNVAIYS